MLNSSQEIYDQTLVRRVAIFAAVVAAIVFLGMMALRSILVPLLVAAFLAYILRPVVLWIETKFRTGRTIATSVVLLIITLLLAAAVIGVIPVVQMEIDALTRMIPAVRQSIMEGWLPWVLMHANRLGFDVKHFDWRHLDIGSHLATASQTVGHFFIQTSGILGSVLSSALIPIFLFVFLLERDRVVQWCVRFVPDDIFPVIADFLGQVDRTMRAVLGRQFMVACVLAILYTIGFNIVGLPFSLAVGLIAGIARLVPYLDVIIGFGLATIIIVSDPTLYGWYVPLGVSIVIGAVQLIDGVLITPRLIGDRVGLHPLLVIMGVLAFGDWLGFTGVLIAIPVLAVGKILLSALIRVYLRSPFYLFGKRPVATILATSKD